MKSGADSLKLLSSGSRHPFHGQVRLVSFSLETLEYAKFTGAIEDEVTSRT